MVPSLTRALRRPDSTPTADPYLPRCSFKGPWDRRQLLHVRSWKLRRSADDRLLLGADVDHIHISRNVVKNIVNVMRGLDPRGCFLLPLVCFCKSSISLTSFM